MKNPRVWTILWMAISLLALSLWIGSAYFFSKPLVLPEWNLIKEVKVGTYFRDPNQFSRGMVADRRDWNIIKSYLEQSRPIPGTFYGLVGSVVVISKNDGETIEITFISGSPQKNRFFVSTNWDQTQRLYVCENFSLFEAYLESLPRLPDKMDTH